MKFNKKIIWSLSAIAVLALYILAVNLMRSPRRPEVPPLKGAFDEIVITWAGGGIRLFKKEGRWSVGDGAFPADTKKIDEIEKRFRELRLTDLVSKKGYYVKYDLTPDKYTEIIFKRDDTTVRRFMIGKKSPTGRHTFARIDDRPEIYLAEGTFDLVINKSVEDLRDREIVKIERAASTALTVEYRGRVFAFARESVESEGKKTGETKKPAGTEKPAAAQWVYRGDGTVAVDQGKIEALLTALDPLRASSFPDIQRHALPGPLCTLRIQTDRKEVTLNFFKMGNEYLAESSESPYLFGVEKWNVEKFFITSADQFRQRKGG